MPQYDLPLDALRAYRPKHSAPADFDEFWARTLEESRRAARSASATLKLVEVDAGLPLLEVYDVTFAGYDGEPIRGWYILPSQAGLSGASLSGASLGEAGPRLLPVIVSFAGYGGGRGLAHEWTLLAAAGYAQFVMDSRGQGSGHRVGVTPDSGGTGPHFPGLLTSGISTPEGYYYRRLFTDAVRAVEAAASLPGADPERIVTSGGSQGGALSLVASVLAADLPHPPIAAIIDVPFLQNIRHAVPMVAAVGPYGEIQRFLKTHRNAEESTMATLDYFDGLGFAARASIPALYSVGLMDDICPPSTIFASYNAYAGPKSIKVYGYNGHEGGEAFQQAEHLRFLARVVT